MPLRHAYVIARNSSGRPTLQHLLIDGQGSVTACGCDTSAWSRAYQPKAIEAILCRRSACRA